MDWTSILIGALLTIPLSIFANLFTEPVRDYLDKRRTIRLSRKRSKEVQTYLFVRALMEGEPRAKVLLDINAGMASRAATFSVLGFGAVSLVIFLHSSQPKIQAHPIPVAIMLLVGFILFAVMYFISMHLHTAQLNVGRKLRRFHDYENSIREKWGDDAIEEFLAPAKKD